MQGPPATVTPVVRPVAARGLSLALAPKRDRRAPYKFTASGALRLPAGVDEAERSCSGKITIQAKLKTKKVASKTVSLTSACRFKAALTTRTQGHDLDARGLHGQRPDHRRDVPSRQRSRPAQETPSRLPAGSAHGPGR